MRSIMMESARENGRDLLSDEKFNKLLDHRVEFLTNNTKDLKQIFATLYIHHIDEGGKLAQTLAVFPEFPKTPEERQAMVKDSIKELVKAFAKDDETIGFRPLAAFFVAEAWAKKFEDGKVPDDIKSPSSYKDKKEIIVLTGSTIDQRKCGAVFNIKRTPKNKYLIPELNLFQPYAGNQKKPLFETDNILDIFWKSAAKENLNIIGRKDEKPNKKNNG